MAVPIILGPDGRPLQRQQAPVPVRPASPPPAGFLAWREGFRQRIGA